MLHDASFRGVAFFVEAHTLTGGRRLVQHEYPLRDLPYAEDMGRKGRMYSVECYLLGADYLSRADELMGALEEGGPATLVHPYLGSRRVAVAEFSRQESTREGGLVRFKVSFVETGDSAEPDSVRDTSWAVGAQADQAGLTLQEDFAETWSTSKFSEWVRESGIVSVRRGVASIRSAAELAALPAMSASTLFAQATALHGDVTSLVGMPQSLASRLLGLISFLGSSSGGTVGWSAQSALASLYSGATPSTVVPATPGRIQAAANDQAVTDLVRRAALVEAARGSATLEYESYDQAAALRDSLADALDTTAASAPDAVYLALTDLRTAMVVDITARGADLARLGTWTPTSTIPALVVAHKIYGDAGRAEDIVARNRVRRPGAVPGGMPLEVLVDA
ncbi:DNA circulation family protein [Pseudodesulfovibrio aespoeensis Aspo-2]|uniref:DNA circulation family protein n=2 Tax=Desulfovibrionaceae TaxID=194924 RepID=E6VU89_PSEA9|nr:DNA circularization N-terminal domain-containing protein [Pseudodesulfovibrio aespoeensis]ADU63396.1 DNA circulation family protein [Pseudodesulfovibrio aespoeensis Aspo-2]